MSDWDDKYQEFWDMGAQMAETDGHPFLIVDYSTSERDDFEEFLADAIPAEWHTHQYWPRDFYGYTESYDACSDCQHAICTQPTSGPADKHWFNESWGDILCVKCTQEHVDDYLEWYAKQIERGHCYGFILDPEENNFTLVLPNCANGFHEGDADDPRKIARWATQLGIQVAFKTWQDQFTVNFDVYMRYWNEDTWEASPLPEDAVAAAREALCERVDINRYYSHCTLRQEFREIPSLAERCMAALRGQ